jgi:hypothetical protein
MQDNEDGRTNDPSEIRPAWAVVSVGRHPRQATVTLLIEMCRNVANGGLTGCGWRGVLDQRR